jgi:hypothetical protein
MESCTKSRWSLSKSQSRRKWCSEGALTSSNISQSTFTASTQLVCYTRLTRGATKGDNVSSYSCIIVRLSVYRRALRDESESILHGGICWNGCLGYPHVSKSISGRVQYELIAKSLWREESVTMSGWSFDGMSVGNTRTYEDFVEVLGNLSTQN